MLRLASRRSLGRFVRRLATETQAKPDEQPQQEEKSKPRKFNVYRPEIRMKDLLARESPLLELSKGKVERPPFVKNLFANAIDERFLSYPEVLEPAQVHDIAELYERIRTYVGTIESHALKNDTPQEVIDRLRELDVFGAVVPHKYGGLGLSLTEYAKIVEAFARQPTLAAKVIAHSSSGVQPIMEFGSVAQKTNYLPKLASGEWLAAFAMHETEAGTDAASVKTTLRLAPDESSYTLNGTKTYVTNGQDAALFNVICSIDLMGIKEPPSTPTTAVLVERSWPGVKVEPSNQFVGLGGVGLATVTFDNVKVPIDSVLGLKGEGFQVAKSVLSYARCSMTAALTSTAREAVNLAIRHAIKTHRYKRPLYEFQMIGKRITDITADVYAMESAVYMTMAIADVVEDPDYSVEAAAARIFCTEAAKRVLEASIDIHGVEGMVVDHDLIRWLNDIRTFDVFEATPNMCRLLVSMSGVQCAGLSLHQKIRVLRDPAMYPVKYVQALLKNWREQREDPKTRGELDQFVHPSLRAESIKLEQCMTRLGYAAEVALQKWGAEVMEQQSVLHRLADIAVDVYVLATVLARASRSYCIGLPNADYDVKLCQMLTDEITDRVKLNLNLVIYQIDITSQMRLDETSTKIFNDKKYIAAHPLTRNWD